MFDTALDNNGQGEGLHVQFTINVFVSSHSHSKIVSHQKLRTVLYIITFTSTDLAGLHQFAAK